MDPDYRDGLGNILRRTEKRSGINDVIFGVDLNEPLCEFSSPWLKDCALPIGRAALNTVKTPAIAAT
jgi:hypothetical protein